MKFTIFGASGFLGSHLVRYLRSAGHDVDTPGRADTRFADRNLGHVIYAIGLTGSFRQQPFEAVEAHVSALAERMREASFESWLYLSSTRVYGATAAVGSESDPLRVMPGADGLYEISKLLGESLCLGSSRPEIRVARLSNVYGSGQSAHTFLGSLLADVAESKNILIGEDPDSSKDYIAVSDAVRLLARISLGGRRRLYNVARGFNVAHRDIAERLRKVGGVPVEFALAAPLRRLPQIDVSNIESEFGPVLRNLMDDLDGLVESSRR
jgi:nucleoside-diphosphate-sugar epimerase